MLITIKFTVLMYHEPSVRFSLHGSQIYAYLQVMHGSKTVLHTRSYKVQVNLAKQIKRD